MPRASKGKKSKPLKSATAASKIPSKACPKCKREFATAWVLNTHIPKCAVNPAVNTAPGSSNAPVLLAPSFEGFGGVSRPMPGATEQEPFAVRLARHDFCLACGEAFFTRMRLEIHIRTCKAQQKSSWISCPICQEKFLSLDAFRLHLCHEHRPSYIEMAKSLYHIQGVNFAHYIDQAVLGEIQEASSHPEEEERTFKRIAEEANKVTRETPMRANRVTAQVKREPEADTLTAPTGTCVVRQRKGADHPVQRVMAVRRPVVAPMYMKERQEHGENIRVKEEDSDEMPMVKRGRTDVKEEPPENAVPPHLEVSPLMPCGAPVKEERVEETDSTVVKQEPPDTSYDEVRVKEEPTFLQKMSQTQVDVKEEVA